MRGRGPAEVEGKVTEGRLEPLCLLGGCRGRLLAAAGPARGRGWDMPLAGGRGSPGLPLMVPPCVFGRSPTSQMHGWEPGFLLLLEMLTGAVRV